MDGRERVPQDDHWCRAELSEGHSPCRVGEVYVSPNSIEGGYMKQQHSYKEISNPRAPRKISAYGMMIGVHGRGTARLFDPRPLIEAVWSWSWFDVCAGDHGSAAISTPKSG